MAHLWLEFGAQMAKSQMHLAYAPKSVANSQYSLRSLGTTYVVSCQREVRRALQFKTSGRTFAEQNLFQKTAFLSMASVF
uniref:Uncharacterized protein n=2 Tax=Caenorhabditis japonica TaxID=281687 RepID=A0A8R1EI66_CAEJA